MKALIKKDFYILQKYILLYIAVVMVFQGLEGGIFISSLYAAVLPASIFGYDDKSRWGELAAMMPYSRRDIVLSRYILGWVINFILVAFGEIARIAFASVLHKSSGSIEEFFSAFTISSCFLASTLPIYFRFDAEKSRTIRLFMIGIVYAIIGGFIGATFIADSSFSMISTFSVLQMLVAIILLNAISIPLSMLAYQARQKH